MPEYMEMPRPKHGVFKQKEEPSAAPMADLTEEIRNISRRLKVSEERYTNLRTKVELTEQNMLSRDKQISTEIKTTNADVHELKKELAEIKERMLMLIKELQTCAKREEVKVLEKYINLWEPVNFVTRNEVEDIIKDILGKK